jgi:hypothetical protein
MKTIVLILALITIQFTGTAQVRIDKAGSPDFELCNTNSLNTDITSRMFFKNGVFYTGGMGTVGTGTITARLSFFTQAALDQNMLVERMSILNNGFVGIANNNPLYPLHLKSNGIGFTQESTSGGAQIGFYTSGTSAYIQTHNNIPMNFATNNSSPQMTLATTGRLGIGTTTPLSKLDVRGKTTITQQAGEDDALEVVGAIKSSGTYPAAFVVTSGQSSSIVIDSPISNGNPNAIILVTNRAQFGDAYFQGSLRVYYNGNDQKWYIEPTGIKLDYFYDAINVKHCDGTCSVIEDFPNVSWNSFDPGMKFNVLIIDK